MTDLHVPRWMEQLPPEKLLPCLQWYRSRPECVQRLMDEFNPGMTFLINGAMHWLIGWDETDHLILSRLNPADDFDRATSEAEKVHVCAEHIRESRAMGD